jgi:hypothetical protein
MTRDSSQSDQDGTKKKVTFAPEAEKRLFDETGLTTTEKVPIRTQDGGRHFNEFRKSNNRAGQAAQPNNNAPVTAIANTSVLANAGRHISTSKNILPWREPEWDTVSIVDGDYDDYCYRLELMKLARRGNDRLTEIQAIARRGFNMRCVDEDDRTIMHHAARYGHYNLVSWLLSDGYADLLSAQDKDGKTPLHYAAHLGRGQTTLEILEYVVNKHIALVDMQDANGDTALHLVIRSARYPDIGEALLVVGASEHFKNTSQQSPHDIKQSNIVQHRNAWYKKDQIIYTTKKIEHVLELLDKVRDTHYTTYQDVSFADLVTALNILAIKNPEAIKHIAASSSNVQHKRYLQLGLCLSVADELNGLISSNNALAKLPFYMSREAILSSMLPYLANDIFNIIGQREFNSILTATLKFLKALLPPSTEHQQTLNSQALAWLHKIEEKSRARRAELLDPPLQMSSKEIERIIGTLERLNRVINNQGQQPQILQSLPLQPAAPLTSHTNTQSSAAAVSIPGGPPENNQLDVGHLENNQADLSPLSGAAPLTSHTNTQPSTETNNRPAARNSNSSTAATKHTTSDNKRQRPTSTQGPNQQDSPPVHNKNSGGDSLPPQLPRAEPDPKVARTNLSSAKDKAARGISSNSSIPSKVTAIPVSPTRQSDPNNPAPSPHRQPLPKASFSSVMLDLWQQFANMNIIAQILLVVLSPIMLPVACAYAAGKAIFGSATPESQPQVSRNNPAQSMPSSDLKSPSTTKYTAEEIARKQQQDQERDGPS